MKSKLGTLFIALGVLALLGAAGLFGYNQWDNARAEKAADAVLNQLEETLEQPKTILPGESEAASDTAEEPAEEEADGMTVTFIDGYDYIGYVSIPSIGLALPVMKQWSYPGDLVVAGHNYARHFSPIKHLAVGTEVLFVDMDGKTWHYEVSAGEVLQPTQIEKMTVKSSGDDWDLTLFTCTTGGSARCAVRCTRVETAS